MIDGAIQRGDDTLSHDDIRSELAARRGYDNGGRPCLKSTVPEPTNNAKQSRFKVIVQPS
jgi:hypothetical protein